MRILFLECNMGAAGDMLSSALYDMLDEDERKDFINRVEGLKQAGIEIRPERAEKCHIYGTHMRVLINGQEEKSEDVYMHEHGHHHEHDHDHEHGHEHSHEHHHQHEHRHEEAHGHHHQHTGMGQIKELLDKAGVSGKVREDTDSVYRLLAEAEAKVHGSDIEHIHFHEVGTLDAVADIVSVCILMDMAGADRIICSPLPTGYGEVRCMHGVLPVPAPATAQLLMGLPTYAGDIEGELTTPTGAALIRHFVNEYGQRPVMKMDKIGVGTGSKDFERANIIRVMAGEAFQL